MDKLEETEIRAFDTHFYLLDNSEIILLAYETGLGDGNGVKLGIL
ncbi:MAG: hypothetical protein ACTSVK_02300 [Promethearchaeota archaeon]